jgi:hypothetical protein
MEDGKAEVRANMESRECLRAYEWQPCALV